MSRPPDQPRPDGAGREGRIREGEGLAVKVPLSAFFRATLGTETGNRGFIGLSPDGAAFHVVVPVDAQIARGLKPGHRPTDETPFGGYVGWRYFECQPFPTPQPDEAAARRARWFQARTNARAFESWAAQNKDNLRS